MSEPSQTGSDDLGPRPAVYARLRADAERRWEPRTPPRWSTPAGWAIRIAIAIAIGIAIKGGPG